MQTPKLRRHHSEEHLRLASTGWQNQHGEKWGKANYDVVLISTGTGLQLEGHNIYRDRNNNDCHGECEVSVEDKDRLSLQSLW